MMKKGFGMATVFLILVTAFCVKGTVMCKENSGRVKADRYYAALEDDFLQKTKTALADMGYENCGVTMTRVTEEDGFREYTVFLYHRKLGNASKEERNFLMETLAEGKFEEERCHFVFAFPP